MAPGEPVAPSPLKAALQGAVMAAGPRRHVLAAKLALRLALVGAITEVSFTVACGDEAADAARAALADLSTAQDALPTVPSETAPVKGDDRLGGELLPDSRETTLGRPAATLQRDTQAVRDRVVAILAAGPSHSRALAAQLRCRVEVVLAALHALERAGRISRSRRKGWGVRWTLAPDVRRRS
jgi:hypothetical protein